MSEIRMNLPFPLDDDRFFRRECPFCRKEFKVLLEKEELIDLAQKGIDSFMIEAKEEAMGLNESELLEAEFTCPYCGQQAPSDSWWTQEQLAYMSIVVKNIMAKIVNENFTRPLKRTFRRPSFGMVSIRFEGKEMEQQEPWISHEVDDMEIFDLLCCKRKIKIEDNWIDVVYCFFVVFIINIRIEKRMTYNIVGTSQFIRPNFSFAKTLYMLGMLYEMLPLTLKGN